MVNTATQEISLKDVVPTHIPSSKSEDKNPNGMNQVGSGPAALLYTLSNKLISIYSNLEELYDKMTQLEVSTQNATMQAGYNAQKASAAQQSYGILAQFGGTLFSGVMSLGQYVGTNLASSSATQELSTENSTLSTMKSISEPLATAKKGPEVVVGAQPFVADQDAMDRASELESGQWKTKIAGYENADQLKDLDLRACRYLNGDAEKTENGVVRSTKLTNLEKKLSEAIASQSNIVNAKQTELSMIQTRYGNFGQMGTAAGNAASQGAQAHFTQEQGMQQASQQISQGIQSMAASQAETTRQGIGSYYNQIASLIAAARQGSQAYAQT